MNLSDFLARFDAPVEESDGYLVKCPSHPDSHESLRVTVSDAGKVLLKCRVGCPTVKVLDDLGLTFRDLTTMTPDGFDLDPATSRDTPAGPAEVAALAVQLDGWAAELATGTELATTALSYAATRFGLTEEDCTRLGLGAAGPAVYDADRELVSGLPGGPRLVVPFRDVQGVARGYQARALSADAQVRWLGPKSPEGASWSRTAFFPGSSGWDEVLITEGPGDALTAVALGYDVIGIRGAGLASNPSVIEDVAAIVGDRLVVIAGDGDPAGRAFASTLAEGLLAAGVRVKRLPVPERHDLTSWREANPRTFLTEVVRAIHDTDEDVAASVVLSARDLARYPFTDLGNARYARDYVTAQGSGVKFAPETGYYLLHGGIWSSDKLDRTRAYVHEAADRTAHIARQLSDAATTAEDQKIAASWRKWAAYSQSSRGISAALKELSALPDVATALDDFDTHPDLLAVENGVVDLRTGELNPHDPALLLTKKIATPYDPTARAPRWELFLHEVFPSYDELPAFMQRFVGYSITGRTDEQCFAVLWGKGANGKSIFTDTITEVFRDHTITTGFSTFEERSSGGIPNDLAALRGARIVMASEGEQGKPMAEAVLKRITGRDLISARFLHREFFEFRPAFTLFLASNFKPKFRGQDEGLWRRVKLIPWERYFAPAERDHHLGDKLLAERSGILAWAVRGAVEWYARGLQEPEVVRSSTKEYRETSDNLAGFFPGKFITDPDGSVLGADLYVAYREWADEEGLRPTEVWRRTTFYGAMEERGLVKRKTAKGQTFTGIRKARPSDHHDEPTPASPEPAPITAISPAKLTRGASLEDVL